MAVIGTQAAVPLVLALYEHPFFREKPKPEKEELVKFISAISTSPRKQIVSKIKYSPEVILPMNDWKGRPCKHNLIFRVLIDNNKFSQFGPSFFSREYEAGTENAASYSSINIVNLARHNQNLVRIISKAAHQYTLNCKYETRWEFGDKKYIGQIPIFLIPGLPAEDPGRVVVCLHEFGKTDFRVDEKRHPYLDGKKRWHWRPTRISDARYNAATGDDDFYISSCPGLMGCLAQSNQKLKE